MTGFYFTEWLPMMWYHSCGLWLRIEVQNSYDVRKPWRHENLILPTHPFWGQVLVQFICLDSRTTSEEKVKTFAEPTDTPTKTVFMVCECSSLRERPSYPLGVGSEQILHREGGGGRGPEIAFSFLRNWKIFSWKILKLLPVLIWWKVILPCARTLK